MPIQGLIAVGVHRDERGVSPTVGIVLMVAIVVLLAAVIGGFAMGFESKLQQPSSKASFDGEYVADGAGNTDDRPYINLTFVTGGPADGERVYVVDSGGNRVAWSDTWTGGTEVHPGEYVHIDGYGSDGDLNPPCKGEEYTIVLQRDDGYSESVDSVEIHSEAEGAAKAKHC